MTVTPIHQMRRQMPEQGRIRIGKKGARGAPQRLSTFRFTSHDELAIREIARRYGGDPTPWSDGPRAGEWEVISNAARVPVLLPPAPLGEGELATPIYEMWSGGGCLRRCDGEVAKVPDGESVAECACICLAKGIMECKPKTRLIVILREIRFGGGWRIESGGWTAATELPGMVDMLLELQSRGIIAGELVLREEKRVKNGRTTKWMVPMLTAEASADELTAGQGTVGSLGEGSAAGTSALAPTLAPTPELIPGPRPDPGDLEFLDGKVTQHEAATYYGETGNLTPDADIIDLVPIDDPAQDLEDALAPQGPIPERRVTVLEVTFYNAVADLASLPECDGKKEEDVRHALVQLVTRGSRDQLEAAHRRRAADLHRPRCRMPRGPASHPRLRRQGYPVLEAQ